MCIAVLVEISILKMYYYFFTRFDSTVELFYYAYIFYFLSVCNWIFSSNQYVCPLTLYLIHHITPAIVIFISKNINSSPFFFLYIIVFVLNSTNIACKNPKCVLREHNPIPNSPQKFHRNLTKTLFCVLWTKQTVGYNLLAWHE